jgi:polyisoprenoid-binding protein YceI
MKKLILFFTCISFSFLLLSQEDYKLTKSKVQLTGTSTLHDWSADVTKSTGSATLTFTNGALTNLTNLNVNMEAKTIKSEKGSTMDKKLYEALKTSKYPNITFVLTKANAVTPKNGSYEIKAEGKLTISGTTKVVNLTATGKKNAAGDYVFSGSKKLKMTEFNVEPPVMFLGTLKTGDEVTITFETTFSTTTGYSQK